MEVRIGQTVLALEHGDITRVFADAIVNAANNEGYMGGGVAAAIRRRGGKEIEDEAVAKGPWPVGEAVVTGAGKLPARYVVHAATMGMDFRTSAALIRAATTSSLVRAKELGLKSVAFPALGAGVGQFPLTEVARMMVEEASRHIGAGTSLERVVFVMYDDVAHQAFQAELRKLSASLTGS